VNINWASLGTVVVVAAATTMAIVLLVTVALVGLSPHRPEPVGARVRARSVLGPAVAGLCLLTAALIVGYGLYLIVA
jgi:hypothetical protein